MPIAVKCPGCGGKFGAQDEAAGKRVKCPKCSTVIVVGNPTHEGTIAADLWTHNAHPLASDLTSNSHAVEETDHPSSASSLNTSDQRTKSSKQRISLGLRLGYIFACLIFLLGSFIVGALPGLICIALFQGCRLATIAVAPSAITSLLGICMIVGGIFCASWFGQRMSKAGSHNRAASEPRRIMGIPANEWEVFLDCGAVLGILVGCWSTIPEPLFGLYALCTFVPAFLVAPIILVTRTSFQLHDHLAVGFAIVLLAQVLGGASGSLRVAKLMRDIEQKEVFAPTITDANSKCQQFLAQIRESSPKADTDAMELLGKHWDKIQWAKSDQLVTGTAILIFEFSETGSLPLQVSALEHYLPNAALANDPKYAHTVVILLPCPSWPDRPANAEVYRGACPVLAYRFGDKNSQAFLIPYKIANRFPSDLGAGFEGFIKYEEERNIALAIAQRFAAHPAFVKSTSSNAASEGATKTATKLKDEKGRSVILRKLARANESKDTLNPLNWEREVNL